VANNGSPAGGSRAAAGRRAAMRSTLDDHARDPHNPRDNRQDHNPLTRTTEEVSRGAGVPCRAEEWGARYVVPPCIPLLGLATVSACRKKITIARPHLRSGAGPGGARALSAGLKLGWRLRL
jgi:hypothetical protein